ncbi:hypothetical protein [Chryseobacterium vrystaatense]|uniref:DUF1642 domain-containing protein n=1 Tax=Chryseobacterium vrystaatense TaxID=307480 RepID=A0ABR4UQB5_9FLAO|nr:hypothetical protein [Chryseobacterium vrystaatense]KFF27248.1 hypothetical protein IW16_08315 [Chryseobacterium vrystaatense]
MKNIKQLNIELKNHLEETAEQLVKDLVQIIDDKKADDLEDRTEAEIRAFYFEYQYDYLDITAWATDKSGNSITNPVLLPTQRKQGIGEEDKWSALLPEKIWKEASDFQEKYEDEDDFDDFWDEYNEEKYKLFEDWFCECWKRASGQTGYRKDAYFSIHDTYFKTDLNTLQTINDDEIAERYTS